MRIRFQALCVILASSGVLVTFTIASNGNSNEGIAKMQPAEAASLAPPASLVENRRRGPAQRLGQELPKLDAPQSRDSGDSAEIAHGGTGTKQPQGMASTVPTSTITENLGSKSDLVSRQILPKINFGEAPNSIEPSDLPNDRGAQEQVEPRGEQPSKPKDTRGSELGGSRNRAHFGAALQTISLIVNTGPVVDVGASAPEQVKGGVPVSDRTVSVGLQIDRGEMRVVSFTLKDRPFLGPAEPVPVRPFSSVGIVQIEVQLFGGRTRRFVRRVDLGPLCFEHDAQTPPHVQGDTILVHRDAFLIELPEIEGLERLEVAYYVEHLGAVSQRSLGTDRLSKDRFRPAAGSFTYSDLPYASTEDGGSRTALSSTVMWPEDFGDPDIIRIYGDPDDGANRINIVIVPDGYTYAEKAVMETHASAMVNHYRSKTPHAEHDSFINYTLVYAYSVDSGTDQCDCGIVIDTAMGTRFPDDGYPCLDSGNRCLFYGGGCDSSGTMNIIAAEQRAPFQDQTIIMVNTPRYGGCGGTRAVYAAGHSEGLEISVHELGHSLGGLADEYAYYTGCGVYAGGINTSLNGSQGAWPEWIADLGSPREGAQYFQSCIYRPLDNCEMRQLNQPFCQVCNQRWALVYFGHPRINPTAPIRSATPLSPVYTEVGVSQTFSVITRLATGTTNEVEWTLEGPGYPEPTVVASDVTEYTTASAAPGQFTLRCRVAADRNFIKPDRDGDNVDTSTWIVCVDNCGTGVCQPQCSEDLDCDGIVGPTDLAIVLGNWGPCSDCPEDFNDDGNVGPFDLAMVLGHWGPCP